MVTEATLPFVDVVPDRSSSEFADHERATANDFAKLRSSLLRARERRDVYVTIDGSFFDNLPEEFADADLAARSLFARSEDPLVPLSGIWLVPLSGVSDLLDDPGAEWPVAMAGADPAFESALDAVLAIVGGLPAAVFWLAPAGMSAKRVWRHLRSINRVEVPYGDGEPDDVTEMVIFRHADGDSLAQVVPSLDDAGVRRLLGPACDIVFLAPSMPSERGNPLMRVQRPEGRTPRGPLRFDATAIEESSRRRLRLVAESVADHLWQKLDPAARNDDEYGEFEQSVEVLVEQAYELGAEAFEAYRAWALLQISRPDDLRETNPRVEPYLAGLDLNERDRTQEEIDNRFVDLEAEMFGDGFFADIDAELDAMDLA